MSTQIYRMQFYRVKKGQTLCAIARAFGYPPRFLAARNRLKEEVREGQILLLPAREGNLYTVRGGESKTLLCGSAQAFEERNGTKWLFPTQQVYL
ncbi:MAG: LysM peptidoglycan-binding domain-containing protein [Clostridia bacterium]|nr:LysM peptidoglycan-binding domain-containing protein [Clostridia bacterium]